MKSADKPAEVKPAASLPVRGAWVEIWVHSQLSSGGSGCRSPCGERGLKFSVATTALVGLASLPVRGAWVEIVSTSNANGAPSRRSPCGERGLKLRGDARCLI